MGDDLYMDAHLLFSNKGEKAMGEANFGYALAALNQGKKVAREGWNGKGMWIAKQVPDVNSKMTEPYTYMKTAQGGLIPWLCSQADMYATDWTIVE